ncbi:MAG TPA: metallophosphoesterase [bacterium]|nr:metallophosphoesterase [bacterium]
MIKAFVIADIHSPDEFSMPEIKPEQFDLVLTLGDISVNTIDYILLMSKQVKVLGVLGNHDPKEIPGLDDHHGKIVEFKGIRFGFLKGAPKYKDEPNHLTEKEMLKAVNKMGPVDVMVSHAPPPCAAPNEDRVHKGFEAFDLYIQRHKPKYWLHGHLEKFYTKDINGTKIIGVDRKRPLPLDFS